MGDYKSPEWLAVLGYGDDYLASLKQKALLFDAFLMTAPARRADHLLKSNILTDLDFLKSKGILLDIEQAIGQTPRVIQRVWDAKPPRPEPRSPSGVFDSSAFFDLKSDPKILGEISLTEVCDEVERKDYQGGDKHVRDVSARINTGQRRFGPNLH